jgi:hypothetical protein
VPCVDATCSVDSSTSTGELHERVYAPHNYELAVEEPVNRRLPVAFAELAMAI